MLNWFYNLSIRNKLILSFTLSALVAGFIGFQSLTTIQWMMDGEDALYRDKLIPLREIGETSTHFQRMRSNLLVCLVDRNPNSIANELKKADERNADVVTTLAEIEKTLTDDEDRVIYKALQAGHAAFVGQVDLFKSLVTSRKFKEAQDLWMGDLDKSRAVVQTAIEDFMKMSAKDAELLDTQFDETATSSNRNVLIILLLGILLTFSLGLFIANTISKPINDVIQSIENADLNSEFASERKDEVGGLMRAFDGFVQTIKETLLQVAEATQAVASASAQISSSTEEMAAGAHEQTSQAGEVASAVEEMTKTIIENSRNASSTAETAKMAKIAAEQGGSVVEQTVAGMGRIAEVVERSAVTVKALGKSSDQIGEIISVIDDIADQTNLLALNAAIEAARAGEQGRGFAVVADEVRKLAERTTKATKEIAGMIKQIQTETAGAVSAMDVGTKEAAGGKDLANKAGESLKEIVEISQKVTDMVGQIAAASEQQSSASEQISKNVEAISAVTGETASGTQQIARAAEDLNRLTENLQAIVDRFQINRDSGAKPAGKHSSAKKSGSMPKQHHALTSASA